jgi:hypothetical protein
MIRSRVEKSVNLAKDMLHETHRIIAKPSLRPGEAENAAFMVRAVSLYFLNDLLIELRV